MHSRLTVFNQKGGVGKTTTVLNLGAALARRGLSPVLVDLAAQAHLTSILAPVASGSESPFAYYQDSKPLTELARRVLLATERVLIPISTDFLSLRGALQLDNTLQALEHVLKRRVQRRYLLTRFDGRRRMSHDIAAQVKERFGDELCDTRIAENVSIAESPAHNLDVFSHAPASRGASDYDALLEELLASGFWEI